MTTTGSDFDIAKAVEDHLKGLEKDRQHRILRWVAQSLSLDLSRTATTGSSLIARYSSQPFEKSHSN